MADLQLVPSVNPKEVVRDDEMLRLFAQGLTMAETSRVTGWSYVTIRRAARRTSFLEKLKNYDEALYLRIDEELKAGKFNMASRIEEAASEALDEMLSLARTSKRDDVKYKACQDLMDREPTISRTKKVEGSGLVVNMPINMKILQATALALQEEKEYFQKKEEERLLREAKVVESATVN